MIIGQTCEENSQNCNKTYYVLSQGTLLAHSHLRKILQSISVPQLQPNSIQATFIAESYFTPSSSV